MRIKSLANQTITHHVRTGYNRYGRETVASGNNIKARVEVATKPRMLPNGEIVEILAVCYIDLECTGIDKIQNGDRVTYDSTDYKVFGLSKVIDGKGNIHHYKLELSKWQT